MAFYGEGPRPPTLRQIRAEEAATRRLRRPVLRRCENDCEYIAVEITRDDGTRNTEIYQRVGTEEAWTKESLAQFTDPQLHGVVYPE
jgi:hypothetical protein